MLTLLATSSGCWPDVWVEVHHGFSYGFGGTEIQDPRDDRTLPLCRLWSECPLGQVCKGVT